MVFRRFGEACRYPVVFRNDGLDGSMLGCFHRQVQGIRASQTATLGDQEMYV